MSNNPFGNLKSEGLEESQDRLGGGFQPLETDIYTGKLKAFYAGQSDGGAKSVTIVLDVNGKEYRETIYVTNKAGENFFLNKDDKTKKVPLPGFTLVDDMCLAATGLPLADQVWEEKVVKIYDFDAKKEMPKGVLMPEGLMEWDPISLAIVKFTENKGVKQPDGSYEPGPEVIEKNGVNKVFHTETKMTMAEARQGKQEGEFWGQWLEKNKGVTQDRRKVKDGAAGVKAANRQPPQAGDSSAAPRKSLFGKK